MANSTKPIVDHESYISQYLIYDSCLYVCGYSSPTDREVGIDVLGARRMIAFDEVWFGHRELGNLRQPLSKILYVRRWLLEVLTVSIPASGGR